MDPKTAAVMLEFRQRLAAQWEALAGSGALAPVLQARADALRAAGDGYGIDIDVQVSVTREDKQGGMNLLSISVGEAAGGAGAQALGWGETFRRYRVGADEVVAHDLSCPVCWGLWGFMYERPECPSCAAKLGQDFFLLLDGSACPYCRSGDLDSETLECSECGRIVPKNHIAKE